jgi:hypothetical protein
VTNDKDGEKRVNKRQTKDEENYSVSGDAIDRAQKWKIENGRFQMRNRKRNGGNVRA